MRSYLNKIFTILFVLSAMPELANAADTAASKDMGSYNPVMIMFITLIVILLFAIGVVGNVLKQLVNVYRDKMRAERKSSVSKIVLLLIAFSMAAFPAIAADAEKTAKPASGVIGGMASFDFYSLVSVVGFEILILVSLVFVMRSLIKLVGNATEAVNDAAKASAVPKASPFWDRFNSSVSIEKERDILLDHDYDGIQELDNSLPPWWKYGFYVTIIVACIYMYRFHVSHDGLSSKEEYAAEMKAADEEKAAYLAKSANNVDETNVTVLNDADNISAGKIIFETTCAPCHLKDGGGVVGPNLTDDYWLHGGGIKDIFKTIKYGYPDKGMQPWKDQFSAKQIQQLASYVKSLRGTHPAVPKAPQGDLYVEAGKAANATPADTTKK